MPFNQGDKMLLISSIGSLPDPFVRLEHTRCNTTIPKSAIMTNPDGATTTIIVNTSELFVLSTNVVGLPSCGTRDITKSLLKKRRKLENGGLLQVIVITTIFDF